MTAKPRSLRLDEDVYDGLVRHGGTRGKSRAANRMLRAAIAAEDRLLAATADTDDIDPASQLGKVIQMAREHGPEVGLQALLLAAGAQLNENTTSMRRGRTC